MKIFYIDNDFVIRQFDGKVWVNIYTSNNGVWKNNLTKDERFDYNYTYIESDQDKIKQILIGLI
jgi:hypothetical protein